MTEQEVNNLIDSKIGKVKMSQLPEATQTSGLYSIGYAGNQSVKYKANLLQGDPLTVRKTYQTEVEALADKNPIDPTTSLPLTVGQFVSIVDDGEKNGIYRIASISGDGTMSLELQGKLGDLSEYVKNSDLYIENEVKNGDFSNGIANITNVSPLIEVSNLNGLKVDVVNNVTDYTTLFTVRDVPTVSNTEIYYSCTTYSSNVNINLYGLFGRGVKPISLIKGNNIFASSISEGISTVGEYNIVRTGANYSNLTPGSSITFHNIIRLNLTEIFGEGKEPDAEFIDYFIQSLDNRYLDIYLKTDFLYGVGINNIESIENSLDTIENILVDGNFENGIELWIPSRYSGLTRTKEADAMKVVYNSNNDFAFGKLDVLDAPISNKVYVSFEMRSNKSRMVEVSFGNKSILSNTSSKSSLTISTEWKRYSTIPEPLTEDNQKHLTFKVLSNIINDWVEIRKVVVLDLSEIFGVSSEPSLEKIDSLVNVEDGYWNRFLPQKHINNYLLQNINGGGGSPSPDQSILLNNELSNGDFSENISGVTSMQPYVSVSHVNNSLKIAVSQDVETAESLVNFDHLNAKSDDLYYFRIKYTSDFESSFYGLSGSLVKTLPIYVGENSFGYINNGAIYQNEYRELRKFNSAKTIPSGSTLFINNILKINLTELFGKGNEPSVESFENLLEIVESDVYSDNIELPLSTYVSYNGTRIANKLATIETAFWNHLELHDRLTDELSFARVEPYLAPPSYYDGNFGSYPSLLKFYNGTPIQDADDWELRREEIKTKWHGIMGEWPELITDQELVITDTEILPDYIQHTVTFEWSPGHTTSGYLLVPFGDKVKPAVVTVYYEPETPIGGNVDDYRDFARQQARDGFVALSIGADPDSNDFHYPSKSNSTVQPLSMMAYCAANAWHVLSKVENVDAERIGIVGQSYGGKWALFASCLFDKFAFGVWSDCGITIDDSNYFDEWYLGTSTPSAPDGAFNKLKTEGLDLPEIESLMFPRPFLVSGGDVDKEDKWTVLNRLIEVYDFFGVENKVAMTNRSTHSHNAKSNAQVRYFFEHFLKLKKQIILE